MSSYLQGPDTILQFILWNFPNSSGYPATINKNISITRVFSCLFSPCSSGNIRHTDWRHNVDITSPTVRRYFYGWRNHTLTPKSNYSNEAWKSWGLQAYFWTCHQIAFTEAFPFWTYFCWFDNIQRLPKIYTQKRRIKLGHCKMRPQRLVSGAIFARAAWNGFLNKEL